MPLKSSDALKARLIKGPFSKGDLLMRASLRAARLIRELCEEKGHSHSRLIEPPIIADDLVTVGRSIAGAQDRCREHVVPCKMIVLRCHEMLAEGASDEEIAAFIRQNLRIVLLGKEERRQLDGKLAHNLKTTMPGEWAFGACTFERLTTAGIAWTPDEVEPSLAEALALRWPVRMAVC